ncbi:MAG: RDD family protein [candidate division FCPU426 bacterium]
MAWHYLDNGKIIGPLSDAKFAALRPGLAPRTQVWKDGMESWQALDTLPESAFKSGRKKSKAAALPEIPRVIHAGFGARLVAMLIDKLILFSVLGVFFHQEMMNGWSSQGTGSWNWSWNFDGGDGLFSWTWISAAFLLLSVAYETVMVAEFGATLGKLALGLKVLRFGERLAYPRSLARAALKVGVLSAAPWLAAIQGAMVIWGREKKSMHDFLCSTGVTKA